MDIRRRRLAILAGMADQPQSGPLSGLVVTDLSTILAGPYCTMLLADLGADVVKVEPPHGDATRGWGPPWVGDGAERTAAYYLSVNRNKRSIRLDLKRAEGAEVLRRLLGRADVLVENFRVGGMARLGFDERELARLNPRLVHLAISGFGPDGPAADSPGYDFVIQAMSGLMSITGFPDESGGQPTKVGVAITDLVTGMLGAVAVLASVVGCRGTDAVAVTAGGQRIDVSLLGGALATLVNQAQNAFATGEAPIRRGNAHPNIVPYETFATADGELAVAVGSERQWLRFCSALDLAELASDPRFSTNGDRVMNRDALRPILAARLAERPTAAWLAALEAAEVPCGPILDVVSAFDAPAARARKMSVDVEHPRLGRIRQVGLPFELSSTPASIRTAPPLLGEHSDEILAELGYDAAEVGSMRASGVI
jgi:crotonobetainyl-CoA:carnitine CoA-transferase CaiB-like acyl-CoA transferase